MKTLELKREEPTQIAYLSKENVYIDHIKINGSKRLSLCILKFANTYKLVSGREFIFFEDSAKTGKLILARRVMLSDYESCTANFPLSIDDCHDGSVTLVLLAHASHSTSVLFSRRFIYVCASD